MHQQTEVAVSGAQVVLQRKQKIEAAIQTEVAGLADLIADRLQGERDYRKLECQAAIGEGSQGLAPARKAAEAATAALEQASLRLGGYRAAIGELGAPLVSIYDVLSGALPAHNASVVSAFQAEWENASRIWALVLGKRRGIETALGAEIDLPEVVPAAVAIDAETTRPAETLTALEASLRGIGNFKKIAERPLKAGTYYDPSKIYKLTSDRWKSRGLPKGSLVCDASFEPGRLSQAIELEEARPVADRDIVPGITLAAAKADQIDKMARAQSQADSERRLYVPTDENLKRSDRLHDASYHPPAADADKAHADIAAGIAGSADERDRQRVIDKSLNAAAEREEKRAAEQAERNKLRQPSADPKREWPDALS